MSKWESAAPSTPLAWEDTCLVTEMTPGGTLAHIYQLTSTDQVSCALSSMLGAWDEKAKPLPSRLFHLIVKTGKASIRQQRRHGERNLCFTLPPLGGKQGARGELTRQYSPQGVPSSMGHPIARGSPLVLGL